RGKETMTLTLRFAEKNRLLDAQAAHDTPRGRQTASLTWRDKKAVLRRAGDITEVLDKATPDRIVTTAPDWSDIIQLAARYERGRGGKQEFPGLWIHPTQPPRLLTFTIEHVGSDSIQVKDKEEKLARFRITLRSGAYLVWTDSGGQVIKLMVPGKPASAIVLA